MAIQYLKQPYVSVAGVDLSAYIRSVGVPTSIAELDSTAGNSAGATSTTGGLMSGSLDIECNQDYAAAQVDATLWAALIGAVPVAFVIRPSTAAVAVTNPQLAFNGLVSQYDPLGGAKVGDLIVVKPTIKVSGAVTRTTA